MTPEKEQDFRAGRDVANHRVKTTDAHGDCGFFTVVILSSSQSLEYEADVLFLV